MDLPHDIIYACCLLCSASYYDTVIEIKNFVTQKGKIFESIFLYNTDDKKGSYVIAENGKYFFLAIRGTYNLSDWDENLKAWPSMTNGGAGTIGQNVFHYSLLKKSFFRNRKQ